ncbi:MAG: HNH endonuclease signature motif containing protein [Jatrophihabitantaceae bacterium]
MTATSSTWGARIVSCRPACSGRCCIAERGCCAYPGCTSRAGPQAHHVRHWIRGGRTDLANLVLLCERHHRGHHEGEFAIEPAGRRTFGFVRTDNVDLSELPDAETLWATAGEVEREHASTADDAATPRWDGDRMDRAFAVSCLSEGRVRERRRARGAA